MVASSTDQDKVVARVENFAKRYGKKTIIENLSLEIPQGGFYGLIGPDGAGKSSLLKSLAGVMAFDGGTVEVLGVSLDSERASEKIKNRIGFMPQGLGLNLYPELSVNENIDFFAALRSVSSRELKSRKKRLLEMTRLEQFQGRPMQYLSGGMKQKLGLVCTLIHEPEFLIFDEPTTGVDPVSRREFWLILTQLLQERQVTAVISTAYLEEAERFHRMSLISKGRIILEGAPQELYEQVQGTIVVARTEKQLKSLKKLSKEFPQVEAQGNQLRIFVEQSDDEKAKEKVSTQLEETLEENLQTFSPTLEDIFIALLRKKQTSNGTKTVSKESGFFQASERNSSSFSENGIVVEAKDLVKEFGKFRAVDQVNFKIHRGEIYGLLGANGAGKTTVIKMLIGILPATSGSGQVAGGRIRGSGQTIRERIGYMSQDFSLYEDLTVVENIRLYATIYGLSRKQCKDRLEWIVEMAGLEGHIHSLAGRLPVGMRQRLALGCALVHQPEILFLDEPTSGLDPVGRRSLWKTLFHLSREEGVSMLVTTHYMSEAEHCDHLGLMHEGKLVADASPEKLRKQLEDEVGRLVEVEAQAPLKAVREIRRAGYEQATLYGRKIHLLAADPQKTKNEIENILSNADIELKSCEEKAPSMENVFVYRIQSLEKEAESKS